jgi:DNA-directed RNA polymerase II subunit RPB1
MDLQPTEQGAYFFKRAFMGIMSPEEIERQSVVEITETTLYEDHLPKKNGLLDPRMGPLDRHIDCETCGQSVFDCVGHPGHIRLCKPVFQPYTLPYVHKTLRCFCFACSSLLISTSRATALGEDCKLPSQKLSRVSDWCSKKAKRCPTCGFVQPTISRQQYILFVHWKGLIKTDGTDADEKKFVLWPEKVISILRNVADENLKYLGLPSRPENMIISILCVSPVTNRPPVHNESAKGSDMLTKKMTDILLHNEKLRRYGLNGAWKPSDVHQYFQRLQYHVTTLMNSTALGSGKPVNNLRQPQVLNTYSNRVNSKEGWVRGNSMGKRVDNSARAVITPDSNIAIDEVGLPKKMAMKLIFPEPVTPLNRLRLIEMVNRGPNSYPGATILQRKNGDKIDLKYRKPDRELKLELGDVVHRHILTGDRVLVNRQPSLHRMSMMSHKAVILPGDTIRLNPSVTTPYNADFDGDEMNIHVETTYDAVAEGQLIMDVPNNILSPTTNRPIIGFVMDHLLAVCLMSTPDIFLTKADFMLYLSNIREFTEKMQGPDWMPVPAILKPEPLWTGKQLLSLLIPKNVRLDRLIKNAAEKETEEQSTMSNTLLVHDGDIIAGYFKKNTISGGGSLIHKVVKKRGPYVCSTMIYDIQRVTNRFMQDHGFSFGPEDCAPSPEARRGIKRKLAECYEKCEEHTRVYNEEKERLQTEIKSKIMRDSLLKTLHGSYEDSINKQCTLTRDAAGTIAATALPPRSEIKMMVSGSGLGEFGSKGSYINISQLAACVGPVNISGKLPQKFFKDRCLPCFPKNSDHPDARGMVSHSFHDTLGPAEYFFHAMGGREGLMDTAVKVSYTGYLQRRLTKACESVEVLYDGTVRDAQNNIIQFVYGEDGLDCTLAEFQDIGRYTNSTDQEFVNEYRWSTSDTKLQHEYQKCWEARRFFMEYRIMMGSDSDKFTTFVNVTDLLGEYRVQCRSKKARRLSEADASAYVERLEQTIKSLLPTRCNRPGDYRNDDGKLAFVSHIRLCLASKRLSNFGIPLEDACKLLEDIEGLFMKAVINPGEMAGVVAAEAIGEPSTQMTLNTVSDILTLHIRY